MDFNNHVYFNFELFGIPFRITDTILGTWIIMAFLILIAIIVRIKFNKFEVLPKGFQNFIEMIVEMMDGFVSSTMGKKYKYFGNWFFGIFAFILCSNLSGLFGFRAPTADFATTLTLALTTFVLIHFTGIKTQKGAYFKSYLEPMPFLLPLNVIGELAKPISLSFRLFGNLLGGTIIMGMVYYALPLIFKLFVPSVLHIYFDLFAGCLQTFIFVMLSMAFIADKTPSDN